MQTWLVYIINVDRSLATSEMMGGNQLDWYKFVKYKYIKQKLLLTDGGIYLSGHHLGHMSPSRAK